MKKSTLIEFLMIFLGVIYKYIIHFPFVNNAILYTIVIVTTLLAICDIINSKFSKNALLKITFIGVLSIGATIISKSANLLFLMIFVIAFYKKEPKRLVKYFLYSLIFGYAMTIILNLVGIIPSHNITRYGETRYSLGFIHPNSVYLYFIFICLAAYYCTSKPRKIAIITLPIAIILYMLCLSRTGIVTYFAIFIVAFIKKEKVGKITKKIVPYLFPVLTIITILLTYAYSYGYGLKLNELLSGRLTHYWYYTEHGVLQNPFGSRHLMNSEYTIDNYYLYVFLSYGYVGYILWMLVSIIATKKCTEDDKLIIIKLIFLIYGLTETEGINSNINFILTLEIINLISVKTINRNTIQVNEQEENIKRIGSAKYEA